jgi:DNA polymerase III subunit epsilon
MLQLNLKKPLVVFDLETTGAHIPVDRIVEISLLKVDINNQKTIKTLRINPQMPIPYEVSSWHL